MTTKKKLIEVALPLEAINRESAREKSIRHGHPSTLHLWWARRPLAACRAVLFASLVDDPSSLPEQFPTEEEQDRERKRLFGIIEELVKWENSNNETVLEAARREILRSTDGNPPPVLDPFCGGGSIPLEAQRLGLEAHGSDLNPVAVLITKALIEIPPKFANQPPVNPESRKKLTHSAKWKGAQGLAEDVRYYGKWMRDEAEKRIGHLYPKVKLADGREATVIAWLWARTVKCPNPACGAEMPLVRSFALSTKNGKETSVVPIVNGKEVRFEVKRTSAPSSAGTVDRNGARCLVCGADADLEYVRVQGRQTGLGVKMMAIVAEDSKGRIYLEAGPLQVNAANVPAPDSAPDTPLPEKALGFRVQAYGIVKHRDLFTPRQLLALTTFSDLAREARMRVHADACAVMNDDGLRLTDGGRGVTAYADAVATYLAFGLDKNTLTNTTLATWQSNPDRLTQAFSRHAMPMTWDFAEANPLSEAGGGFVLTLQSLAEVLERLPVAKRESTVEQLDARSTESRWRRSVVFTDPPYYDNIGYADLSDYFYVWQRRTLRDVWPSLTSTLLVPKSQELIASQFRHEGDSERARKYFEDGMRSVFRGLSHLQASEFPINVIYAFKQSEEASDMGDFASTGWETMLDGFVNEGFQITGTWPIRSELVANLKKSISALASSIVICGRLRNRDAPIASRREFILALKSELPEALRHLQHSSVAAVDLAQAAIGPGMAVFSRYAKVIEADGSQMRVRSALQLINQALDEVLSEQETEYDADTQWAVAWFTDQGMAEGAFGIAETLSKAKNTSVDGLVESGLLSAAKGKVRLIPREQLDTEWDPTTDRRLTIWEVAQHLIARLKSAGEQSAADLLRRVGGMGEIARDLAYRLYSVCERKGWTEEAIAYNSLVVAWPEITRLASQAPSARQGEQMSLG